MINRMFNAIRDINFVKVTKTNWARIEILFEQKESQIISQKEIISKQSQTIESMILELDTLRKFKAQDDLLYSYEELCKEQKKEIRELTEENKNLVGSIIKADKKVQSVLSLESAYLQKIIRAESKARTQYCPDYETKGDFILERYA